MKVSFVKAPIGGIIGLEMITFVEPLGFECVAGGLELEGHTCQIVDLRIDGIEKGIAKVRAFEPEIVGLQCNFTTERFRMLRLARRIKQEFPDVLVVAGGHDASRDPRWFLKPGVDVIRASEHGNGGWCGRVVDAHEGVGVPGAEIPGRRARRADLPHQSAAPQVAADHPRT